MKNKKIVRLVQFSLLLAIEAIVCFTPLGSLPIGPLVATLAHIPVIITAVTLGTGAGTLMGLFTGIFSFIVWTFMPPNPLLAFVFTPVYPPGNFCSLLITIVPRVLIGTFSGLIFSAFDRVKNKSKIKEAAGYTLAGIAGSLANTVLVLGGIYVFFGRAYAEVYGIAYSALLGAIAAVIATNGVLELVIAAVAAYAVGRPIRKYLLK